MTSITVPVPPEMKKKMEKHKEIEWPEIAKMALQEKLDIIEKMDKLLEKSTLTEKDALRLGRKVNKAVSAKYY